MKITVFFFLAFVCSSLIGQESILFEDFQSGELPQNWTIINNDGYTLHPTVEDFSDAWLVVEDKDNSDNFVIGSASYFEPVDRADRWLISPEVSLEGDGNVLSWFAKSHDPSFPDSYAVLISPNAGNEISDFTDTLGVFSNETPEGIAREYQINEYASSAIRVAFVNNTFNGFKLYLDSIEFTHQNPLSTTAVDKENIEIYPNPTAGKILISGDHVSSITLINSLGKVLKTRTAKELDLSPYPSGLYYLRVQTTNGIIQRKIVKL